MYGFLDGKGVMGQSCLGGHLLSLRPTNWNLFDSDYLHFLFAIYETIAQAMMAIANGIINKKPTSQGALVRKCFSA